MVKGSVHNLSRRAERTGAHLLCSMGQSEMVTVLPQAQQLMIRDDLHWERFKLVNYSAPGWTQGAQKSFE